MYVQSYERVNDRIELEIYKLTYCVVIEHKFKSVTLIIFNLIS